MLCCSVVRPWGTARWGPAPALCAHHSLCGCHWISLYPPFMGQGSAEFSQGSWGSRAGSHTISLYPCPTLAS